MDYKNLLPEEKEQFCKFLQTVIIFSDEQYATLAGEREMTQEMFESCLAACVNSNDLRELNAVCEQYPDLARIWAQKIDHELHGMETSSQSEKEKLADWEQFKAKLHSRYGIII